MMQSVVREIETQREIEEEGESKRDRLCVSLVKEMEECRRKRMRSEVGVDGNCKDLGREIVYVCE